MQIPSLVRKSANGQRYCNPVTGNPIIVYNNTVYETYPSGAVAMYPSSMPITRRISYQERLAVICQIPRGKVIREADMDEWFKKKYQVCAVCYEEVPVFYHFRNEIPFWSLQIKSQPHKD